jgi:hypothetical protein
MDEWWCLANDGNFAASFDGENNREPASIEIEIKNPF